MDVFKTLAKECSKIEAKNSELKNGHGYDTASSTGLFDMEIHGGNNHIRGKSETSFKATLQQKSTE